jgi:NAD+ diphosphatase
MKYKYCPQCGSILDLKELGDEGLVPFCPSCKDPYFDSYKNCIITVVINEYSEIALLRQDYVSKTNWVLVAGYIKQGETFEESVIREVEEETGQKVQELEYISSYYYEKKELLMAGFQCNVLKRDFNSSRETNY